MPWSIGVSRRSGDDELMTVKTDGSRSSVASSTPRAIRTISIASRLRCRPEPVAVDRLVGERQHVVDRVEVADRRVDVDRLDRVAGEEVDDVEHLAEPDEVLVVGPVADPPAAVEVVDVRRARHRPEGDPVAADLEVVRRVRGVERERRRRGLDPLERPARARSGPARCRPGRPRRRPSGDSRASGSRKSIPISASTRSEARWIDSSSSAETTSVGRVADPRLGPRPLRRQPAALARGRVAAGPAPAGRVPGAGLDARHVVDHRRS